MAKINLPDTSSGFNKSRINQNFQDLADELNNNVLYRNNPLGEPNQMENALDMNSNQIINVYTDINDDDSILTVGDGKALFLEHVGDETKTGKLTLAGGLDMASNRIINVADPLDNTNAVNLGWANTYYLNVSGDAMDGLLTLNNGLNVNNTPINNVADPVSNFQPVNLGYANTNYVNVSGDTINGTLVLAGGLNMNGNRINNVDSPIQLDDAANKLYVDQAETDANLYTDAQIGNAAINPSTGVIGVETTRQIGDGATVIFNTPATGLDSTVNYDVFIDGVRQKPTLDYTISNIGQVAFAIAPEFGTLIDIKYFKPIIYELENVDAVIPLQAPRLIGDDVNLLFQSPISIYGTETSFFVNIDGVAQRPYTDFTCNNSGEILFVVAPADGSVVDITYFNPQPKDTVETTNPILMVNKYITADATISDPYNALSVSPTITSGVTVTVEAGAEYVVL